MISMGGYNVGGDNMGKPSKGTKADRRLKANKQSGGSRKRSSSRVAGRRIR